MVIVNMVIVAVMAFGIGYIFGKGKIEIVKVANKTDSAEIVKIQEEVLHVQRKMEEAQQRHLEEYENQFGKGVS